MKKIKYKKNDKYNINNSIKIIKSIYSVINA